LPPYEVAFVVDGNIPGVKAGEVTIDVSTDMKPAKPSQFLQREPLLEVIGWEAMKQVGVGTKTGYEAAEITFRNKDYKEIGLGFYVANQRAADIVNRYMREERGWKVDYFGGEVPQGGVVTAYRL
jgi:hypothetical protein